MKQKSYILNFIFSAVFPILFLNYGCVDIIDVELSKESVKLVAPADSVKSDNYTQRFVWEELNGADEYQLRIVRPGFHYIEELLEDTVTERTEYIFNLTPGSYQWGVRGLNGSSATPWSIHTIIIDSSLNLSGVLPKLLAPLDNLKTNDSIVDFQWAQLSNADTYHFKLVEGINIENGTPLVSEEVSGTSYLAQISKEGTFTWGIQAKNSLSFSVFSTRTITTDRTPPPQPVILQPLNNSFVSSPFEVTWTAGQEGQKDTLVLSDDPSFTTLLSATSSDSLSATISASLGLRYIKIKRTDQAGNHSESDAITLNVQ
jgi:hypothetical protein